MDNRRLKQIMDRFADLKILVVGDFFLDQYLVVDPTLVEVSVETGLAAHQVVEVRTSPGAAGTVCSNLASLGLRVEALGAFGQDGSGYQLLEGLKARGIGTRMVIQTPSRMTPTYTKPMKRSEDGTEQEMERLDIKNRTVTPADLDAEMISRLAAGIIEADGVIVGDQVPEEGCGVITPTVRAELSRLAVVHPNKVFLADSRSRVATFRDLIIKPNEREATAAVGDQIEDVSEIMAALFEFVRKPVFLTRGEEGSYIYDGETVVHCPAVPVSGPLDIVGAGDSASAGIVSALCAGATLQEAGELGNLVASVTVRKLGTTGTASQEEVLQANGDYRRQAGARDQH